MGLRPLRGPPCIPPEAPPRRFSASAMWRGHASCAAGASLTRCARSGDLPPRRVNAIARYRIGQIPFQPNTMELFTRFVPRFDPLPHATRLPEIQNIPLNDLFLNFLWGGAFPLGILTANLFCISATRQVIARQRSQLLCQISLPLIRNHQNMFVE